MFKTTEDEIERREAATAAAQDRRTARRTMQDDARPPAQRSACDSPTEWRDSNGRPVHALACTAKVATVLPKAAICSKASEGPVRIAAFIASAVDGHWGSRGLSPSGLTKLNDLQGNYLTVLADFVALIRLVSNNLCYSQALVGDCTQMLAVRAGVPFQVFDQGEASSAIRYG